MQELNPIHHWGEFCYVPLKSYKERYYVYDHCRHRWERHPEVIQGTLNCSTLITKREHFMIVSTVL